MNLRLYTCRGIILVCRRRGAQQTGHLEPAALVRKLGGRDRAGASTVAALRLQAPARAARGWLRGVTNRSAAAPLSTATGAAHGARRLARPLPALLDQARRCPGTTPEHHGQGAGQGPPGEERKEETMKSHSREEYAP